MPAKKKRTSKRDPRVRKWAVTPMDAAGYRASVVQKVAKRWKSVIGDYACESYFLQASMMERGLGEGSTADGFEQFRIRIQSNRLHREAFRQFWDAAAELHTDRTKVEYWLCVEGLGTGGFEYDENERPILPKWAWVSNEIMRRSGRQFTDDQIQNAAHRLGFAR